MIPLILGCEKQDVIDEKQRDFGERKIRVRDDFRMQGMIIPVMAFEQRGFIVLNDQVPGLETFCRERFLLVLKGEYPVEKPIAFGLPCQKLDAIGIEKLAEKPVSVPVFSAGEGFERGLEVCGLLCGVLRGHGVMLLGMS